MDPRERLMQQIRREAWRVEGTEPPTEAQVAMVMHALADHTAIVDAINYSREGATFEVARSIGRWFHAVGDLIEQHLREQESPDEPR